MVVQVASLESVPDEQAVINPNMSSGTVDRPPKIRGRVRLMNGPYSRATVGNTVASALRVFRCQGRS